MDTACIRILEPDTAFSKVSVSAYTNQLSIRIRIHTHLSIRILEPSADTTLISVRSVPPYYIILPYAYCAPPQAPGDPSILQQILTKSALQVCWHSCANTSLAVPTPHFFAAGAKTLPPAAPAVSLQFSSISNNSPQLAPSKVLAWILHIQSYLHRWGQSTQRTHGYLAEPKCWNSYII